MGVECGMGDNPYHVLDDNEGLEHRSRPVSPTPRPGAVARLLALQGNLVDHVAVKAIEAIFMSRGQPDVSGDVRARIDEARQMYGGADLISSPDRFYRPVRYPGAAHFVRKRLGRLRGGERLLVRFASTYETFDADYRDDYARYAGNETNWVRYWTRGEPGRPVVICVHTWCGGSLLLEEQTFAVRALYRRGFDVALVTLPFHGKRVPAQGRFSGQIFPNRNLRRTNEGFGQAVADLRLLWRWLRTERRCGPVGMIGMSLGGHVTALMASLHEDLAFAVPIVAPASIADVLWHHGQGRPGREEAESVGFTLDDFRAIWSIHCPLSFRVRLPLSRLLIVWGEADHVVPSVHQLALWEHWGRPQIRSFAGGHIMQVGWRGYWRWILRWLDGIAIT